VRVLGRSLRLLPPLIQVLALKNKFSGMLPQLQAMMGGAGNMPSEEMMMGKLEQMREV